MTKLEPERQREAPGGFVNSHQGAAGLPAIGQGQNTAAALETFDLGADAPFRAF